ncbi:MAG: asparagine synthase C-terminal domain-containing protein, partial [Hyphomicrobiaceae bacterium]
PGVPREPNLDAIHAYLTYQYVPSPMTAFRGICKLPPGCLLVQERGAQPRIEPYYRFPRPRPAKPRPVEDLCEELVTNLREATRLRLISDVPLGAFLSGGVDSSAIVAMMAQEASDPVRTYTIGFEDEAYDERKFARMVAERYATDHHEYIVRPNAMEVLPNIVYHYGEPFADSSAIPTYYVSQIARQQVTVALTGDGGDESFLGYARYKNISNLAQISRLPTPIRTWLHPLLHASAQRLGQSALAKAIRVTIDGLGDMPSRQYEPYISYFSDTAKQGIYGDRLKQYLDESSLDALEPLFAQAPTPATGAAWADIHTYLPDDLLVKVDVASMAHSLECRSPFLDHKLMEWAADIPEECKMADGETKSLLKKAMEPFLPRELLYRPKMGFGVPIDRWLKHEMRGFTYDVLLDGSACSRGLFDQGAVRALLDGHCNGQGNAPRIWALLMLELWYQMWIDSPELARTPVVQPIAA